MKRQAVTSTDSLNSYLKQVTNIFDISQIINKRQGTLQVKRYYTTNRLTYRLTYNWNGNIHCGISYDGKRKKEDLKEHARIIDQYIRAKNAKKVLELGSGLGANSGVLAKWNHFVTFTAVDLSNKPLRSFAKLPNVHFFCGNYHDLSMFDDNSYDIVFAIETLSCSTDKPQVFREVKKKLKVGGIFVIADVYERDHITPMTQSENIMWQLIARGVASEPFERVNDVEDYMRKDFSIIERRDLTSQILPTLDRQESLVRFYFSHPVFAKTVNRFLPLEVTKNAIVVFLLPISARRQILCYYLHVLQNVS
jgi:ubiquinone/menaquinone biosynthesis C-methylase UbiE